MGELALPPIGLSGGAFGLAVRGKTWKTWVLAETH